MRFGIDSAAGERLETLELGGAPGPLSIVRAARIAQRIAEERHETVYLYELGKPETIRKINPIGDAE